MKERRRSLGEREREGRRRRSKNNDAFFPLYSLLCSCGAAAGDVNAVCKKRKKTGIYLSTIFFFNSHG